MGGGDVLSRARKASPLNKSFRIAREDDQLRKPNPFQTVEVS